MRAEELLTANLALIDRAIAFACRRYQLSPDDAEEFDAVVKLRLVENDYAVLRAYEGRSSFATYISVAVQRMALDYRIHQWGKWHASAEAKRLGDTAITLEKLLHRDGRTFDEALPIIRSRTNITREELLALASRLPPRPPKMRDVPIDEAAAVAADSGGGEANLINEERQRTAQRVSALMTEAIERLPEDERLILQLRFEEGMTVAQISRSLGVDQKALYRRIERCMRDIRKQLEHAGIASAEVLDLIGRDESIVAFKLRNQPSRPSIANDAREATHSEDQS